MKYRIIKDDDGLFKVQKKKLFFWKNLRHDLNGLDIFGMPFPLTKDTKFISRYLSYDEAKERVK